MYINDRLLKVIAAVAAVATVVGCSNYASTANSVEKAQQERGVSAIVRNQPVPDLGGYSFERQVVSTLLVARNKGNVSTWTYILAFTGQIIEICPSIGFPIPYATQLTNPLQVVRQNVGDTNTSSGSSSYYSEGVVGNPEPSALYPPSSADGTWVACSNPDGSISPEYFEDKVFSLPYRIKSDRALERVGTTSSITITPKG